MREQKHILNKLTYLVMIMIIGFYSLGLAPKEYEKKIHSNITIQNIDVGKLTEKQAINKLKSTYPLKDFNITYNKEKWTIKPESIDLNYHIEEMVKEAFNYTRSSSTMENIKRKSKLNLKKEHNIKLKATYDEIKLSKKLEVICNKINVDAVDATFRVELTGELKTTKSKEGREVDLSRLKEDIYDMINKKKIEDINLPVITLYPKVSTKQVKSINSVLGEFSTSFNNSTSRGSNIHVAGQQTSDILLMPGDTFSYNRCTGARNWVNGYKSAPVIVGGKVTNGEGGGVCQVSTTIYNAALMSGLTIDEVHNHSLPSRYVQRGRDATVSYGYTDLKFTNPFTNPVYIKNIVGNGAITSKIYGCNLDREKIIIKIVEEYRKNKITVQTYRLFLDEENNIMKKELVNTSFYNPN
ncbi:MAG: VanW family protein [Terrisporobacter othiniensis]|uniref:VanW family protein n=1 Tax=Terrisporobacter petrolearius TaxID=1460447 RepID=UPI0022E4D59C|nr:VanW family protein [Terrisporobacter petrolearius]MDU4860962.1 VanW family protein [Terrisporobacter othiniensis]MDU6993540.1 VanW family protein [Terrisporobacter othiniensis]